MRSCSPLFRTSRLCFLGCVDVPRAPIDSGRVLSVPPQERHPASHWTHHGTHHETNTRHKGACRGRGPREGPNTVATEFHGGEGVDPDEPEDELADAAERSSPLVGAMSIEKQSGVLARLREVEAATRPGRKSQEHKQMKAFDHFHAVLRRPAPSNDVVRGLRWRPRSTTKKLS